MASVVLYLAMTAFPPMFQLYMCENFPFKPAGTTIVGYVTDMWTIIMTSWPRVTRVSATLERWRKQIADIIADFFSKYVSVLWISEINKFRDQTKCSAVILDFSSGDLNETFYFWSYVNETLHFWGLSCFLPFISTTREHRNNISK